MLSIYVNACKEELDSTDACVKSCGYNQPYSSGHHAKTTTYPSSIHLPHASYTQKMKATMNDCMGI